uniref:Uncharacterized protein n=1 Tax=Peronospora matthiolae TaxID=2874970 RepID=A0AAV1U7X2_9STRA
MSLWRILDRPLPRPCRGLFFVLCVLGESNHIAWLFLAVAFTVAPAAVVVQNRVVLLFVVLAAGLVHRGAFSRDGRYDATPAQLRLLSRVLFFPRPRDSVPVFGNLGPLRVNSLLFQPALIGVPLAVPLQAATFTAPSI